VEGEETEREKEDTPKDWEYYYWLYMNNPDLYWEAISTGKCNYGCLAATVYSEIVLHQCFDPIGGGRTLMLVGTALQNKAERARGREAVDPWELLGLIGLAYVAAGGGEFSPDGSGTVDIASDNRTISGCVDDVVRQAGGEITVIRGGAELFRIGAGGRHHIDGPHVHPGGGRSTAIPATNEHIRELYKALSNGSFRTKGGR